VEVQRRQQAYQDEWHQEQREIRQRQEMERQRGKEVAEFSNSQNIISIVSNPSTIHH